MARKVLSLVLIALVAGLAPACGDSEDDETAQGSNECCKMRRICANCICSDAQFQSGIDDLKGPCKDALDSWNGIGCAACQDAHCLSGC